MQPDGSKGQTTAYVYDNSSVGQGRPSAKYIFAVGVAAFDGGGNIRTTLAAQATTISYNGLGQQWEVDDYVNGSLSRTTTYTYDPIMQQLASTASPEGTIHYVYNAIGQQIETYTDNTDTAYGFDVQGRLTSVTVTKLNGQSVVPLVTSYSYDAAGNKSGEVLPNGIATTYTYDDLNRLTDVVEEQGAMTLFSQSYTLNSDGTRASSTETQVQPGGQMRLTIHTTWSYDALNRLTGEVVTNTTPGLDQGAPPDGLANWFVLPAGTEYSNFNSNFNFVGGNTLMWDGNEYISPGGSSGAALFPPGNSQHYWGGNGSDWVLLIVGTDGTESLWSFTLDSGVFTPDGVVATTNASTPIVIGLAAPGYWNYFTYDLTANRMSKMHFGPGGGPSEGINYSYNGNDELVRQLSSVAGETDFTYDDNGSLIHQVSQAPMYSVQADQSFGWGEVVLSNLGNAQINAQTFLPNGDILVAGVASNNPGDPTYLFLAELDASGNLANPGIGLIMSSLAYSAATSVTVLSNGDILVAGSANGSMVLSEFYGHGSINASFGPDGTGMIVTPLSHGAGAQSVSVLGNGKIVVAGYEVLADGTTQEGMLAEYNANGTLNGSFGSSGIVLNAGTACWNAVVAAANGDLIVGGGTILAEYDANGHLVVGFGSGGTLSMGFMVSALKMLGNGQILVAGEGFDSANLYYQTDGAVARVNADGSLDGSFGTGGVTVAEALQLGDAGVSAIDVLANGEILIAGNTSGTELMLAEFRTDGSLDTSFNGVGYSATPLGTWSAATALSILANGELLVSGGMQTTDAVGNPITQAVLAKYQVSSVPDGYSAATQTTTYTYDVRGKLVAVSRDGKTIATYAYDDHGNRVSETVGGVTTLYLIDTNNPTGYAQPMEAKYSATGKPITTWIIGGRVLGQADSAGNVSYLLADGHGSTRLLTSATGTITAAFNYDAFGTALNFNAGMAATPFLFGGDSFYDAPSGLNFHGDGTRQRNGFWFIESDFGPRGQGNKNDPLSLHKYLYVWGDPINGRDPSGHDMLGTLGAISIGAGLDGAAVTATAGAELIVEGVVADLAGAEGAIDVVAGAMYTGASDAEISLALDSTAWYQQFFSQLASYRTVVISSWNSITEGYVAAARAIGAAAFNLPPWVYGALEYAGAGWAVNQAFLDAAMDSNLEIQAANLPNEGTTLMQEIEYLLEHGYDVWN